MDVQHLIIVLAALLLVGLLISEKRESLGGKLLTKPFLSALFVLTALLQPRPDTPYGLSMIAGLAFCLGGDVLLAFPGVGTFRAGLAAFLVGHLFYAHAFFGLSFPGPAALVAGCGGIAAAGVVYRRLRAGLGAMRLPVICYIVVITVMLCGAMSVAVDPSVSPPGRAAVAAGALLFYLSDLLVARQRFIESAFFNRLAGLPMYYTGQFLLAFSVGSIGTP